MTSRALWATVVLAAGLIAHPADANDGERPFVGQAVAGLVKLRASRQPITYLAFVAEAQSGETIRLRAMTCVYDECVTRTLTVKGTINLVGSRAELTADHPDLGHVALTGPTTHNGPGHDLCDARWGPSGEEPHEFAYSSTGDNYRVNWSGRVGSRTALAAEGFICGRYLDPGVIAVS